MTEPRIVEMDEAVAFVGETITVFAVGADAFAFKTEDGRLFMASMCLGCGQHIGYYEIDESLIELPPDISAS